MKVFLDDLRDAPEGWVRTRSPEETIALLETGEVTELSLDHDLGLDTPERERTGYTVLAWLEREIGEGRWRFELPRIAIHSANPPGRLRMRRAIEAIQRLISP
ncbi:cyclic-phosphate processing receiver domain-containing protein [Gaiella sp.]|uniref:cyclic-phosphate processing receiver domain-containing protein n=1 Tax=Gaiella sp. TaxID=2663207 RepID=UPI002E30EEBC|nr:cyclic-phosphate processing receiver domain-containing protein [Gaiella sp.]HEX5582349.1 cyclic-phosphate processing receiver domain-containing protein [Gaiella sp.]